MLVFWCYCYVECFRVPHNSDVCVEQLHQLCLPKVFKPCKITFLLDPEDFVKEHTLLYLTRNAIKAMGLHIHYVWLFLSNTTSTVIL